MKHPDDKLATPLYVKSTLDMPWPAREGVFHLLTGSGLFICRNNAFFSSSVPAPQFPASLAAHQSFCRLRYAKVPRRQLEIAVGFCARIAELHTSEAGLLLAWDPRAERYHLIVPPQTATVSRSAWDGRAYPIGLYYDGAPVLPPGLTLVGDIHSHVYESAYASATDVHDERHRPGLHIVVGRLHREPPDFHVDMVVDGMRFVVDPPLVLGGYNRRRTNVPEQWIGRLKVETYGSGRYGKDSYRKDSYSKDSYSKDSYSKDSYSSHARHSDTYPYGSGSTSSLSSQSQGDGDRREGATDSTPSGPSGQDWDRYWHDDGPLPPSRTDTPRGGGGGGGGGGGDGGGEGEGHGSGNGNTPAA